MSESFSVPYVVSACSSADIETYPCGQSRSKTLNAAFTCVGVYDVFTLRDITVTNSSKSISPLPSASISSTIWLSSSCVGLSPSVFMSCFSSSFEIVPPLSRSTRLKISWNSASSSSVRWACLRPSDIEGAALLSVRRPGRGSAEKYCEAQSETLKSRGAKKRRSFR